jgi:hypothetical protein
VDIGQDVTKPQQGRQDTLSSHSAEGWAPFLPLCTLQFCPSHPPLLALTSTFPNAIVLKTAREAIVHPLLLQIELLLADGSTVSRWGRKCRREFNGLSLNTGM